MQVILMIIWYIGFPNLFWTLKNIWTDGLVGFTGLNRGLQAQWAYNIAIISKLLWLLKYIWTDGLVGLTGLNRVFQLWRLD